MTEEELEQETPEAMLDRLVVESAEQELEAQLKIVRTLGRLDRQGRERVLAAVGHLIAADACVPGILELMLGPAQ